MDYAPATGGWIEVITGVMFSGKSEELIRRVRRAVLAGAYVRVFKSHIDQRYDAALVRSHAGARVEAEPISDARSILQRIEPTDSVIAVDEVQFLDQGICDVATILADQGRRVILAGTDTDFRGRPFGPMPELLAIADQVTKLHAICVACGALATRNQRIVNGRPAPADSPTIQVGGLELYEARCRACHEVPPPVHARAGQFDD